MTHVNEFFVEMISRNPGDDSLRLQYAEWLEEHGEAAQAEFIRLQIELEGLRPSSPRYAELEDRQDELLAEHDAEWLQPVPHFLVEWEFRRGLVEEIVLNSWVPAKILQDWHPDQNVDFLNEEIEDLFARHPAGDVELRFLEDVGWLTDFPELDRLRSIYVNGDVDEPEALRRLLVHGNLSNLSSLRVSGSAAGEGLVTALLESGHAAQLRDLQLSSVSSDVLRQLCGEPTFQQLTSLRLDEVEGRELIECLDVLLEQPERWTALVLPELPPQQRILSRFRECIALEELECWLPDRPVDLAMFPPQLTNLRLNAGVSSPLTASLLSQLECLPNLVRLEIPFAGQGDHADRTRLDGMEDVLDQLMGPVAHISFWGGIADPVSTLSEMRGREHIRGLQFDDQELSAADMRAMTEAICFPGLRSLELVGEMGKKRTRKLLGSPMLTGVRRLELCDETDTEGLLTLFRSPHVTHLRDMTFYGEGIDARGVAALAEWPGLKRVRNISLSECRIDGPALQPLFDSQYLSPLVKLYLSDNSVDGCELDADDIPAEWRARLGCRLTI